MRNKTTYCVGAGLLCLGLVGVYNAINSFSAPPVEKSDLETKGTITSVYADVVEHRLTGIEMSAHHQFDYEFALDNGEKYYGTETISEAEARSLSEGQQVTVQYYSHYPKIHAAKGYGLYIPVNEMPHHSPMARLMFCLGFCGVGGLLLVYTFTYQKETCQEEVAQEQFFEQPSKSNAPQIPHIQDLTAGTEEQEKLDRYRKAYLAHRE